MNWNLTLFNLVHSFAGKSRFLDGIGFFVANYLTYILVACAILFFFFMQDKRKRLYAFGEALLAFTIARVAITTLIRHFYVHPRPFTIMLFKPLYEINATNSFPSAHMAGLFALSTVIYYFNRKWGAWYFALSLLVGIGRIYAGFHWPADILGGIAIGVLSTLLTHWVVIRSQARKT